MVEAEVKRILLEEYDRFYRLAFSYVRNEADALDIVQESAYKAMKGAGSLREAAFARTWIYRIVVNESLQTLRRKRQTLSLNAPVQAQSMTGGGAKSDSAAQQPLIDFLEREEQGREFVPEEQAARLDLQQAIAALPEQEQTLIRLRFFEELKLEEIAAVLNENLSTIKSRLYRTLRQLRTVL